MSNTINGRTPEEIKQGLEYCIGYSDLAEGYCSKCPHAPDPNGSCRDALENDAVYLIEYLEDERDEYKGRLDAVTSKMKRRMALSKVVMWIAVPSCVAAILIALTKGYDWRAAALAFVACLCGVYLRTLHLNEWEEDDESQN